MPRAPERWPESFGRDLDDDFLIEAFSCQVWSCSVILGRLLVSPGGIELRSWRSKEIRGRLDLSNGVLRALEEAWVNFQGEAFFCRAWSFPGLLRPCRAGAGG